MSGRLTRDTSEIFCIDYGDIDEMANISTFLSDILEAKEKGKNLWSRWLERLGACFDRRFGADWQMDNEEFWNIFIYY